ncbi:EamA family transporter RarD [Pelagovum pacificum]|uniref:EamA family transporter RarD n=1 Tax=Pelagovum pacificum TaxID=2588711 RepID=A0A5C5GE33_9RHOB|nr:EamA family transporter RarD [Pelagovum pacificum]QQA44429.1 EamA family transporter RarD [Pelagovum pacificum]TNY32454.1 EamA family transporter RarD [Pelagovum pacificum]
MTDAHRGVLSMVAACTIWGLSPLYYHNLDHVPAAEVLAHRTLWSLAFFAMVLFVQGRIRELPRSVARPRQAGRILAAGLCIGCNWFGFIYAIHNGYALEASLGYYIFPLLAVLLGRFLFAEWLSTLQWFAVALAGVAVVTLTIGLGVPPWIALMLASTFAGYGIFKKRLDLPPVVSVTAEVMLLSPIAITFLALQGHVWTAGTFILLALSGPITAAPLILFSYASRRVRLSTVGIVQYLNPTLQFLCAVMVFAEPFTPWHQIAFAMIWTALALYSVSAFGQERALRRASSSAALSGTARM